MEGNGSKALRPLFKGGATWSGKNGARKVKLLGNQKENLEAL